jgi:hypothetical protein
MFDNDFRDRGAEITADERATGLKEIEVFKDWVDKHILVSDDPSEPPPIMLLPLGRSGPNYRDVVPPPR